MENSPVISIKNLYHFFGQLFLLKTNNVCTFKLSTKSCIPSTSTIIMRCRLERYSIITVVRINYNLNTVAIKLQVSKIVGKKVGSKFLVFERGKVVPLFVFCSKPNSDSLKYETKAF